MFSSALETGITRLLSRLFLHTGLAILFFILISAMFPRSLFAQTTSGSQTSSNVAGAPSSNSVPSSTRSDVVSPTTAVPPSFSTHPYAAPNLDPDVPRNLHTYAQAVMIEVLSAAVCLLSGINPMDINQPCLDLNPQTQKLGYAPSQTDTKHIGGLVGMTTNMIGVLYTPTTSSTYYFRTLADNFGIVKSAHAQVTDGYGFAGLKPIRDIWESVRNIAYFFLSLAFIFIGLGIMLRIKIDPRTVMTIQNQIPRIVIAILLISFSYPIAAIMIDLMWMLTYVGINTLTEIHNPQVQGTKKLSEIATSVILQAPFPYFNHIFGISNVTNQVAAAIGDLVYAIVRDILSPAGTGKCGIGVLGLGGSIGNCFVKGISLIFEWLARMIMTLIILGIVIFLLFRIWWVLLRAYIYIMFYVIIAPIWIVFGLLPGRPLGFERWIRVMFADLVVFPLTVGALIGARVIMDNFKDNPADKFVPPLVGNPNMGAFGALIAFGVLLMIPTFLDWLRDALKVPRAKQSAVIPLALAGGATVAAVGTKAALSPLFARHPASGIAIGPGARIMDNLKYKVMERLGMRGTVVRHQLIQELGHMPTEEQVKQRLAQNQKDREAKNPKRRAAGGGGKRLLFPWRKK